MTEIEKAIQYVRDNKSWTEQDERAAWEEFDRQRCPLDMTSHGGLIADQIHDLMEEYSMDNDLPECWWLYETDIDGVFLELYYC